MNIDERIEALTLSLEVMSGMLRDVMRGVDELRENSVRDGESIRALARIAEIHERRLTDLENPG